MHKEPSVTMSIKQAARTLGISKAEVKQAFKDLEDFGLVTLVNRLGKKPRVILHQEAINQLITCEVDGEEVVYGQKKT
ncbi:hypothetical protein JCM19233_4928 [Vibrio astriarenae]|nr:hypothetical protein JCM19233_4928 [Vibrio sp. C7]